jgi:PAS domain S-box-containing protein/putative nucleotidyltransferase with HDIG domain
MEHGYILSILYEMALVIGGEVSVKPLLTRMLQRLLYHTSFPAGFVCLALPSSAPDSAGMLEVRIDAAVGDYELAGLIGQTVRLPAQLLRGAAERGEDATLLATLPEKVNRYKAYLRLPIDGQGVVVLLSPQLPDSDLPLTQLFQPVMANLAKAILLCSYHDAYTGGLIAARDASQLALADSDEKFRAISVAALDALIMVDNRSELVYWNPAAERILGYRADEVLGKPLHQMLTPQRYQSSAIQGFNAFRSTGQGAVIGKTIEIEALHKDGREIPVELSISSLKLNEHWHAVGILRDISERKEAERERLASQQRLKKTLMQIIETIAATVEMRDAYTAGHQRRVAQLAVAIAKELQLPEVQVEGIHLAGVVHDVGKIQVPVEILSKPGKLTEIEFRLIKEHAQSGYEILKSIDFPWPIAKIVLQHHERLDGSGYPQALRSDQILLDAKIIAVADVVESMNSHRPYRPGLGIDAALGEITLNKGKLFDPAVVEACITLFRERDFNFSS